MILTSSIILTFLAMEGVAWFTHKYVMHGWFWFLHEDHHVTDKHDGFFERNDWFFVLFATMSMTAYVSASLYNWPIALGVGIGISIYGATYFFIHDLFIHQRIKVLRNTNNPYLKAIRRAHKIHHKHLGKEEGECFGMLWVPMKYYKTEFERARQV